ncbi:hypothetical protein HELRODRAFT_169630 [Helobdella robusta]|uniref:Uncharacterized protein n=1 Tax=Helobdella robusta TaxID=6412 RepID=T1F267_HELRO|nr:hypothetical protein HELRODRAFT_169630 [Helobdella robusta]ESO07924.1 hypothetical protein HELRODRAFT_169630 [Helobdella robusta]
MSSEDEELEAIKAHIFRWVDEAKYNMKIWMMMALIKTIITIINHMKIWESFKFDMKPHSFLWASQGQRKKEVDDDVEDDDDHKDDKRPLDLRNPSTRWGNQDDDDFDQFDDVDFDHENKGYSSDEENFYPRLYDDIDRYQKALFLYEDQDFVKKKVIASSHCKMITLNICTFRFQVFLRFPSVCQILIF